MSGSVKLHAPHLQPRCGVHAVKLLFGPFADAMTSIPSFALLRARLVYNTHRAASGPQESEALADYVIQLRRSQLAAWFEIYCSRGLLSFNGVSQARCADKIFASNEAGYVSFEQKSAMML
jgi:hypothetical protein